MTGRDVVMGKVRRALHSAVPQAERQAAVTERLAAHRPNLIPQRGQVGPEERIELFMRMAGQVAATIERVPDASAVPGAVAAHLRKHNLPAAVRIAGDPVIQSLPWHLEPQLERGSGRALPSDAASLSHAFAGVAETATLMLLSGPDNPTTLNFLPDTHIVMLEAGDIVGDYESAFARLREARGAAMPRLVNFITGPSRSADIEQTLILGAHGPRALHIIVVG